MFYYCSIVMLSGFHLFMELLILRITSDMRTKSLTTVQEYLLIQMQSDRQVSRNTNIIDAMQNLYCLNIL